MPTISWEGSLAWAVLASSGRGDMNFCLLLTVHSLEPCPSYKIPIRSIMFNLLLPTVEQDRRLSSCLFSILYGLWSFKRKALSQSGKLVAQWWIDRWWVGSRAAAGLPSSWVWGEPFYGVSSLKLKTENIVPSHRSPLRLPGGKNEEALNPVPILRVKSTTLQTLHRPSGQAQRVFRSGTHAADLYLLSVLV